MASTDGFWADHGPLGLKNFRRQLGRSDELGDPKPGKQRAILVETGATQKGSDRAKGDAAASSITITCTYEGLNEANQARPLQVRGLVEWGTDGHQAQARFDWLNGTTLHIAGSFVRVIAEIIDNQAAGEEEPSHSAEALVRVGAFVGYFASSRLAPSLTTQVALAANTLTSVEIPTFARALILYGPTLSQAEWRLSPTGVLGSIASPPLPGERYTRPGPATHVALQSPIAGLQTLVWELSL